MKVMPDRNFSSIPPKHETIDEHRRMGRLMCEMVKCSLGEVMDVSASGLRIRGRKVPKRYQKEPIRLRIGGATGKVSIMAKIVWSKRVGLRCYETGLELIEASDELRQSLRDIVYGSTGNTTFYSSVSCGKEEPKRKAG